MHKCLYSIQVTFFFIIFSTMTFAQNIDSMMQVYAEQSAPERLHIHFDKSIYNKGETIWFKIYVLQGNNFMEASKNVYLQWYSTNGKLIGQTVAPLILSTSSGSFDIPENFRGKILAVRAFTSWMLNEDPDLIYQKQIVVNDNLPDSPKPHPNNNIVTVFPEGGFLIEGLKSRIAFKAINSYGEPVLINGVLRDDQNNVLDSIHIIHDGMGSFFLTPKAGLNYHLAWTDELGEIGITPIPAAKLQGARLMIRPKKGKAFFSVSRSLNVPGALKKMTLIVHMNRVNLYQVAINATEKDSIYGEIPTDDLPTGILQFTLFSSEWIPIAERVIFINNHSHEFDVSLAPQVTDFSSHGKNIFELYVPDTLFTNMSVSVTDADVTPMDQHTIFSDLFLSNEIKGKVYNPGYYLSGNIDEKTEHLDLVMLTNAWRRFDWEKIKAHIGPQNFHPIENHYMRLRGKVTGIKFGKSRELNMIIVNKDSSKQFLSIPLQKDGSFEYPVIFFDTAKIIYSIANDPSLTEKAILDVQNGLLQLPTNNLWPLHTQAIYPMEQNVEQKLDILLAKQELKRQESIGTTLMEVKVSSKIKTKEQKLDEKYTSGFFRESPAKKAYILDLTDPKAITSSQTVIEYLMNRIPGLIVNGASMQWRGNSPVYYLNEMRTDIASIRDIPLQHIAMIKAFPPIFMFAAGSGAGGAVAVYTKMGADNNPPDQTEVKSIRVPGYTKFKEFYSPVYDQSENNRTASDNRTTLYWNPNLITNRSQQHIQIEYFNNDFTKTFKVVLEGINSAGKMTRIEKIIPSQN